MTKELLQERNAELMCAYNNALKNGVFAKEKRLENAIKMVVESGASRFYVSEEVAYKRIMAIENGRNINKTRLQRNRLYKDLYNVYLEKKKEMDGYYKYKIVEAAVNSPAPSFYITAKQAMNIIYS